MRVSIFLTVVALVAAACSGGTGETGASPSVREPATSSTLMQTTTSSTALPGSGGTSMVTTEPTVTSTTGDSGPEGFCETVEAALAEIDEAQQQERDWQIEDYWALVRYFFGRLQPVAPTEIEEEIGLILTSVEHFEARARDPEGVASPTEEEGDAYQAAVAVVQAYVETECGIPTIEAVPLN